MNYQLVLQFRGAALEKLHELGDYEGMLKKTLDVSEMFDGLDQGAHGANLFFYTDSPEETLEQVRPLLGQNEALPGFVAAYRTVAGDCFRILWPKGDPFVFKLR
jgi:hypothetical protein